MQDYAVETVVCILLWSVGCPLCENSEAQWELCFFPRLSFHGASLRYFHLFWERRSIIRNATGTTQAHTRTLIPLHLSHQIVQGRNNFCDKARPNPQGNHIVQSDGVNLIIEGSNCDLGVCTDADATQGLFVYVNINLQQWRWKILISVSVVQPLTLNGNISCISHIPTGESRGQWVDWHIIYVMFWDINVMHGRIFQENINIF